MIKAEKLTKLVKNEFFVFFLLFFIFFLLFFSHRLFNLTLFSMFNVNNNEVINNNEINYKVTKITENDDEILRAL